MMLYQSCRHYHSSLKKHQRSFKAFPNSSASSSRQKLLLKTTIQSCTVPANIRSSQLEQAASNLDDMKIVSQNTESTKAKPKKWESPCYKCNAQDAAVKRYLHYLGEKIDLYLRIKFSVALTYTSDKMIS